MCCRHIWNRCKNTKKTTTLFPEDIIIEIFSICDDFSKVFDKTVDQNAITACRRFLPVQLQA